MERIQQAIDADHDLAKLGPARPWGADMSDYVELRQIADVVEGFGLRQSATRLRAIAEQEGKPDERFCAMQEASGGQLRAIPWGLAEILYPAYGHDQTLERLHERGGFGRAELGMLAVGMYSGARQVTRGFETSFPLLDLYLTAANTPREEAE
jgi:hypothetical protein